MMKTEVSLRKSLTLFPVVYLGLAWMTPMIYFSVYGIAYETSQGMLTQAYLLAFLAIFFTACSYGIMSKTFPTSGSAYTYVKKSIHPALGFLVGWALLLDYLFSPLIACLTFGIYLHAQFPSIPAYVWIIILNAILAIINVMGINFSANISKVFVWIQVVFIVVFCAFLIKNLTGVVHPLQPLIQSEVPLSTILAGASIICFCFLGFDSVTTMAEETIDAKKTIPKAILIIISIAIVLYMVPSYLTQLAFPNMSFQNIDSAGFEVVTLIGGAGLSALFITVLILAIFTQGLSSVASTSRLLYVMGRDSELPKRIFGTLHSKFKTPVINITIVSLFSLLALVISLETAVKFVSFGALTAFIFVNLSVIVQRYIKDKQRSFKQTIVYLVFPLTGASFIGWLLSLLDKNALLIGLLWLLLGMAYHFYQKNSLKSVAKSSRDMQTHPAPTFSNE
ncbi:APC family permease [Paenibacillus sp. N5-1-1-5]|uniref:APC family permease n=2 Tax=Paenibacillus radicis (ex Xue et al. 2023) TaxID=2972489 RepID=A0ABT1YEK7_9BACL|nr:APC family permease [Paenibacillus radicis (ex Xue et al. 2023)]MCR8631638.1 APC family permease [Paenibacillus radicis (ex Xue et al. 2023)]